MEFYVSIQLGISSSQLTNSYVSEGVVQPPTRNRSELDVLQRSHKMLPFRCLAIEMSLDVTSHGFHAQNSSQLVHQFHRTLGFCQGSHRWVGGSENVETSVAWNNGVVLSVVVWNNEDSEKNGKIITYSCITVNYRLT